MKQKILKVKGIVPVAVVAIAILLGRTSFGKRVWETISVIVPKSEAAMSETWFVVPDSVHDGDTLRAIRGEGGQENKIRLCGIDAPEIDQPLGKQSRAYLVSLLEQNPHSQIIVTPVDKDRYGRTVAELFLWPKDDPEQEISINTEMLMAGMAYVYPQYVDGCPNGEVMKRAEAIAKEQSLGVWLNPGEKPWEYRKK